ncbi:MAG: hypothetical protein J4F31_02985 [Flavobacteriales bacterium]|nr:hypothetical protein [Flavobacteriales bacterium]
MGSNRKLTPQEENLLSILVKQSSVILPTDWKEGLLVRSMNDDGMGSLCLFPKGEIKEDDRSFGESVSEFQFTDQDGIEVIASLNLDNNGDLFELDIWKTDFSKVIRLPEI